MSVGVMLVPVGDAFAKEIARVTSIAPATVAWTRFVIGASIFVPIAMIGANLPKLSGKLVFAQLIRGALVSGGIFSMVNAVVHAPLAEVFGAFFIAPAISTGLAALFLGERITRIDAVSLGLGLIGVLLVTRPGATINVGLLWALGGGVSYGAFNAATRWSAAFTPPRVQIASQLIIGSILLAPLGLPGLSAAAEAPMLIVGSGVASALANFLLTLAYARASASTLAPLIYLQLLSAAGIGFLQFGETPDPWAGLGLALIFVAGLGLRLMFPQR